MSSTAGDTRTIELGEHDRSAPLRLSEPVLETIESRINESATRLGYEYTQDGRVRLSSSSYVGLVALPNGTQVRIRPKAAGGNSLRLLLYAHGATSKTIDATVEALQGDVFLDAIGSLFVTRLQALLNHGLGKKYRTTEARESHLRGRLDLQRQLARGGVGDSEFAVEYETLTHDTVANQAVLYATHVVARLVTDRSLQNALRQREHQLRRDVTLRPVHGAELEQIHLDRRHDHYEDILRLAKIIIQASFVDNLQGGTQETYGLLVNMNRVFESVVERAATEGVTDAAWSVEAQSHITGLVTGGPPTVNMYPDFVIRDDDGQVRLVGDAKWKTGSPSQSDIYQMTSYQLVDDVPGLLLYPSQDGAMTTDYRVDDRLSLYLRELPTAHDVTDSESLGDVLSSAVTAVVESLTIN
ncbi:McrC family protein [Halobellus marinus]|uniref:McrC family protein n=1 Tax=Halobellus TaxID=1073986 RepID=UPI0028AA954B|nr:restriction endonuclease [Halobellus sp. DFY28]